MSKRRIKHMVEDVLESKRFWLGIQAYLQGDLSYLRAFLIESHLYTQEKTRDTLIRAYSSHWDLHKRDQLLHLKGIDEFTGYDFNCNLKPDEYEMYKADIEGNKEEYGKQLAKVKRRLMGD